MIYGNSVLTIVVVFGKPQMSAVKSAQTVYINTEYPSIVCHSYSCFSVLSLTVQETASCGSGCWIERVQIERASVVDSSVCHEVLSKCLSRATTHSSNYSVYDVHNSSSFSMNFKQVLWHYI